MTTYYVNPQDSSSTEEGTQAEPFLDLQDALDAVETATGAPHTILAQGTQTLTVEINGSTVQDGSIADGFINLIGVNSSWVEDGTMFVLDGVSSTGDNINLPVSYWKIRNLEIKNASSAGMYNSPVYSIFKNCSFHDNTAEGIRTAAHCIFDSCVSYNNGQEGFEATGLFLFCRSYDNSNHGFSGGDTAFYGCISHGNSGYGFYSSPTYLGGMFNCVADDNDSGNFYASNIRVVAVIGSRGTNSTAYGLNCNTSNWGYEDYNFFLNNTSGAITGNVYSGGNTLTAGTEGYTDKANDDYNLTSLATLRRTAITVP